MGNTCLTCVEFVLWERAQRSGVERSCAGHVRQLGGESPLSSLVEAKG